MITVEIVYLLLIALIFLIFSYIKIALFLIFISLTYLLLAGCGIIPSIFLKHLQAAYTTPITSINKKRVAVILFGCSTIRWPNLLVRATFFSYSRIFEAARLYYLCQDNQCECTIIISGADVHTPGKSEAETYYQELLSVGINPKDIKLETISRNTYQNAQFVCEIMTKLEPYEQIFLVTSAIFLKRVMLYFLNFDLRPIPIPSPADYMEAWISLKPSGYNLFISEHVIHEYIALLRFYFYQKLKLN
ncbi:membrane protein [Legionella busanensis]|uniref:Membrane protein n=1 Tax=Legionella busanensis TaxID=190655 RepID=A0A378JQ35_9GAMM|nr:YdcF family protein [Legionella busanensis]STX52383.1 membrane protein [Legionella busanensis]